jgi:hypothetical protein
MVWQVEHAAIHEFQYIPFSNVIQIVTVFHATNDWFDGVDKVKFHI